MEPTQKCQLSALQIPSARRWSNIIGKIPLEQCFPNCASRLPGEARNYVRGGVKKIEKTEKKKLKISIFYYKIPIPILAFLYFNSSNFYFLLLLLTTDSVFLKNI
jgi:hypothetical protein